MAPVSPRPWPTLMDASCTADLPASCNDKGARHPADGAGGGVHAASWARSRNSPSALLPAWRWAPGMTGRPTHGLWPGVVRREPAQHAPGPTRPRAARCRAGQVDISAACRQPGSPRGHRSVRSGCVVGADSGPAVPATAFPGRRRGCGNEADGQFHRPSSDCGGDGSRKVSIGPGGRGRARCRRSAPLRPRCRTHECLAPGYRGHGGAGAPIALTTPPQRLFAPLP
jgi:hypothetical protein